MNYFTISIQLLNHQQVIPSFNPKMQVLTYSSSTDDGYTLPAQTHTHCVLHEIPAHNLTSQASPSKDSKTQAVCRVVIILADKCVYIKRFVRCTLIFHHDRSSHEFDGKITG